MLKSEYRCFIQFGMFVCEQFSLCILQSKLLYCYVTLHIISILHTSYSFFWTYTEGEMFSIREFEYHFPKHCLYIEIAYHEHCLNWTLSNDFARIVLRRAMNSTTGPSLIFLNIEIASKWLLPFKNSSFNDSISSPWIHN